MTACDREQEILTGLSQGLSGKQIRHKMGITGGEYYHTLKVLKLRYGVASVPAMMYVRGWKDGERTSQDKAILRYEGGA